jgi:oligo-1,6-glucosidase
MQWDDGPNAGFTTGTPWIALNPNYPEINARRALADPDSVFHHYRRLIALRHREPTLVYGRYRLILPDHPQIYAYLREHETDRLLVVSNFGAEPVRFELPAGIGFTSTELLIANLPVDADQDLRDVTLRPYEARIHRLRST